MPREYVHPGAAATCSSSNDVAHFIIDLCQLQRERESEKRSASWRIDRVNIARPCSEGIGFQQSKTGPCDHSKTSRMSTAHLVLRRAWNTTRQLARKTRASHPARSRDVWPLFGGRPRRPSRSSQRQCLRCQKLGKKKLRRKNQKGITSGQDPGQVRNGRRAMLEAETTSPAAAANPVATGVRDMSPLCCVAASCHTRRAPRLWRLTHTA